jgi:hypothetical protein
MATTTYNIPEAIKAQEQFCDKNEYPRFTPGNGICWDCHQNIYSENGRTRYGKETHGISVESAGHYLITGCPFCSRSYCD